MTYHKNEFSFTAPFDEAPVEPQFCLDVEFETWLENGVRMIEIQRTQLWRLDPNPYKINEPVPSWLVSSEDWERIKEACIEDVQAEIYDAQEQKGEEIRKGLAA